MARPFTAKERKALKKDFVEKFKDNNGLVNMTCERVGISKQTYENWRKDDETFAAQCDAIQMEIDDMVVNQLYNAINNGSVSALIFYCKAKLGWRENSKIEVETKESIDISKALEQIKKELKNE